jgi:TonB family protein
MNGSRRIVCTTLLLLLLSVHRPGAQESKRAVGPLEGIVAEDLPRGETIYQPRPVVWPVPEILLSPFFVRSSTGTRKLFLGVVLNGVDEKALSPLEISIDGSTVGLELKGRPRIDTSGCVPTATLTTRDEGDLVRRISTATDVQVSYRSARVPLKSTLTPEDLDRFRRVIALHDTDDLPPAPPRAEGRPGDESLIPKLPEGVSGPEIVPASKVEPLYPPGARKKGKSGQVVLVARILKDGTVGTLRPVLINPGGCGFAEAAMEAVRQWKYTPAMKDGRAVELDFAIMVDFALLKSRPRVALFETPVAGGAARAL